jgi:hypothetical protein
MEGPREEVNAEDLWSAYVQRAVAFLPWRNASPTTPVKKMSGSV